MVLNDIVRKVECNFNEILQTASKMIKIPSRNPPGEEKRCAEYIHSKLKELGYETYFENLDLSFNKLDVSLNKIDVSLNKLDISYLNSGSYLLQFINKDKKITRRFIKS